VIRALHLRAGRGGAADDVGSWLARQRTDVIGCEDAYAALLAVLRGPAPGPQLVLLSADALDDDEASLVTHIRRAWPEALVVLYGRDVARFRSLEDLQVCLWPARPSLREFLQQTPEQVVRAMRDRSVRQDAPAEPALLPPGGHAAPPPTLESGIAAPPPGVEEALHREAARANLPRGDHVEETLSAEELAALFGPEAS
jgi:hypothetical protein